MTTHKKQTIPATLSAKLILRFIATTLPNTRILRATATKILELVNTAAKSQHIKNANIPKYWPRTPQQLQNALDILAECTPQHVTRRRDSAILTCYDLILPKLKNNR